MSDQDRSESAIRIGWNTQVGQASALSRAVSRVEVAFNYVATSFICVITLVVCADVFMRYALNAPIHWVLNLSESLMLGILFLTLAYTQARKEHVGVSFVWQRVPRRAQVWLNLVAWFLSLITFIIITWQGAETAWAAFLIKEYRFGVIEFPVWPAKMLIPVGSALLCLRLGIDIYHELGRLAGPVRGKEV